MKQGLVLSGGGAKGGYEAGCIKALRELGYDFDIVTGTSIGALNGLLVTQGDFEALYKLWDELSLERVLKNPINLDFSMDSLLSSSNMIKPFFKSYINEKGADITPLKNLIHGLYNNEKAFNSKTKYGIVTVKFPQIKPLEITINEMKDNEPVEYAIASASCFPAFPVHYINEQGYVDGGYFDNLPISLALNMGADKIIAIELNQEATHEYFLNRPDITFIRPSHHLGGFLDFDRNILDQRIRLGYYDTLKTFKKLKGYRYSFNGSGGNVYINDFYYSILKYEDSINHTLTNRATGNDNTPLTDLLKKDTYISILDKEDYFISGLELMMEKYNYDYYDVYDINQVIDEIKTKFLDSYQTYDDNRFLSLSLLNQKSSLSDLTSNQILEYMYYCINNNQSIKRPFTIFYLEYLQALFIHCILKDVNQSD